MKKLQGFNLIYLIIVIAIIAILVAIAIPIHTDDSHRRKVAEAVGLLVELKSGTEEWMATKRTTIFPSIASIGGKTRGRYTSIVGKMGDLGYSASITDRDVRGIIALIYSTDDQTWTCFIPPSGGIDPQYVPSSCK